MLPKEEVAIIKQEINELQDKIEVRCKLIGEIEAMCQHSWLEPRYFPQKVDYDTGSYGGSYLSHKWERECVLCGKK